MHKALILESKFVINLSESNPTLLCASCANSHTFHSKFYCTGRLASLMRESLVALETAAEGNMKGFEMDASDIFFEARRCSEDRRKWLLSIFNKKWSV